MNTTEQNTDLTPVEIARIQARLRGLTYAPIVADYQRQMCKLDSHITAERVIRCWGNFDADQMFILKILCWGSEQNGGEQ
jgi:hypothetical protein